MQQHDTRPQQYTAMNMHKNTLISPQYAMCVCVCAHWSYNVRSTQQSPTQNVSKNWSKMKSHAMQHHAHFRTQRTQRNKKKKTPGNCPQCFVGVFELSCGACGMQRNSINTARVCLVRSEWLQGVGVRLKAGKDEKWKSAALAYLDVVAFARLCVCICVLAVYIKWIFQSKQMRTSNIAVAFLYATALEVRILCGRRFRRFRRCQRWWGTKY